MPTLSRFDEVALLEQCQHVLGYTFRDLSRLKSALTHASGADHRLASNERLEFLGDAIFGAVVCEFLFLKYPEFLEGDLTRVKSVVVSRSTCARISERLGLEEFLILGKGMGNQGRPPASVLADVFESLIAAIHLDGGLEAARRFILEHLKPEIEAAVEGADGANHKSRLQQIAQKDFNATPTYLLLDVKGPDHSKCFKVAAQVGSTHFSPAWGRNKKDAEQRAALNALCQILGEPVPHGSD